MNDDTGKEPWNSWVILARLVRPQGRYGEVLSEILTDFPERFADRKRLWLVSSESDLEPARELVLEKHWLHKDRIVLKFAGIDSISDAEALRGLLVAIPSSERAPLSDDSVYVADLIGCQIVDVDQQDRLVGTVTDVDRDAGLLAIDTPDGKEALIPFARAYLVRIDPGGKRIEMRLPAGLLEVDSPMTEEERREQHASDE